MSLFPSKDKKDLFMTLLKVMGGKKAKVYFAGSGDSGSIESVELLDADNNGIDLKGAEFEWEEVNSNWNEEHKEWVKTRVSNLKTIDHILSQICEDALDQAGLDWYNNEGGQGSLEIDLSTDPPTITLDVGINHMHTENHSFDHTEDEEEDDPTEYADLTAEDKAREELIAALAKNLKPKEAKIVEGYLKVAEKLPTYEDIMKGENNAPTSS